MAESTYRKTPPRWYGTKLVFDEPPAIGLPFASRPQLPTRLLPVKDDYLVPAPVLSDAIDFTQRLLYFSAHVAAFGSSPGFSNLTSLDKNVKNLATLQVSPFGEGSFVIPAELTDDEVVIDYGDKQVKVHTSKFIDTFREMMACFTNDSFDRAAVVPIGFVQTLQDYNNILGRHANRIEFTPTTESHREQQPLVLDQTVIARAESVHKRRIGKQRTGYAKVYGLLVEINVINHTLKIADSDSNRTILGTFEAALLEPLIRMLGQEIAVFGPAEYRSSTGVRKISVMEFASREQG